MVKNVHQLHLKKNNKNYEIIRVFSTNFVLIITTPLKNIKVKINIKHIRKQLKELEKQRGNIFKSFIKIKKKKKLLLKPIRAGKKTIIYVFKKVIILGEQMIVVSKIIINDGKKTTLVIIKGIRFSGKKLILACVVVMQLPSINPTVDYIVLRDIPPVIFSCDRGYTQDVMNPLSSLYNSIPINSEVIPLESPKIEFTPRKDKNPSTRESFPDEIYLAPRMHKNESTRESFRAKIEFISHKNESKDEDESYQNHKLREQDRSPQQDRPPLENPLQKFYRFSRREMNLIKRHIINLNRLIQCIEKNFFDIFFKLFSFHKALPILVYSYGS